MDPARCEPVIEGHSSQAGSYLQVAEELPELQAPGTALPFKAVSNQAFFVV